jgi:hypothetical protein
MEEKEKKVELGQQRNLRNEIFGSSPLVNNQQKFSIVLHYSYRLDGVKLSGGNHLFSINHASTR